MTQIQEYSQILRINFGNLVSFRLNWQTVLSKMSNMQQNTVQSISCGGKEAASVLRGSENFLSFNSRRHLTVDTVFPFCKMDVIISTHILQEEYLNSWDNLEISISKRCTVSTFKWIMSSSLGNWHIYKHLFSPQGAKRYK